MHTTPPSPQTPTPMPRRVVTAAAIASVLMVGAACSAPTEDTASAADAVAALDSDTRTHVEFESAWQCDLTRFAFGDLSELETMRVEQLEAYGINEDEHEDFIARLDTEPELAEIVAELSGDCAGTDVDIEGPVEL